MPRHVERLEGLLLLGEARVGPIPLRVPELAFDQVEGSPPIAAGRLALAGGGEEDWGFRTVRLLANGENFPIRFRVPSPEVSGAAGAAYEAAPNCWVVHWPLDSGQIETIRASRPELLVLGNARALLASGEPFVQAIQGLRSQIGAGPVLWTPRVALPHRVPMLSYLGVDLMDTTEARFRALAGEYLDPQLGVLDSAPEAEERTCRCPACATNGPVSLSEHAVFALEEEIRRARAVSRIGRLRQLVESRLPSEPLLGELLRYADRDLYALLEERVPVVGSGSSTYVIVDSFRRPEVRRFRERFLTHYRPPPSKRVLLLVPCSRTKPYRSSRSHRRFARALEGLPTLSLVHTVSVTSPLGLVPRELEDTFPARHYDIPVTGEWSEAERRAVTDALDRLIKTGQYQRIVVHLDPTEYAFLRERLPASLQPEWTIPDDHTTSASAVSALRRAVDGALSELAGGGIGALAVVREELQAIACFQFGDSAGEALFRPPVRLMGRPWFQRLTDAGRTDLATWREERGLFQLTVRGGERMMGAGGPTVEVSPEVHITGDLFVPGVARADRSIRAGDAVLLVQQGVLLGVGEARLPGALMTELQRGLAVQVRHRAHPSVTGDSGTSTDSARNPTNGPVV
ncbi:MAG: DUF5591 domain-containing protein [Candidatus Lutacidiplasmatales archaeon]